MAFLYSHLIHTHTHTPPSFPRFHRLLFFFYLLFPSIHRLALRSTYKSTSQHPGHTHRWIDQPKIPHSCLDWSQIRSIVTIPSWRIMEPELRLHLMISTQIPFCLVAVTNPTSCRAYRCGMTIAYKPMSGWVNANAYNSKFKYNGNMEEQFILLSMDVLGTRTESYYMPRCRTSIHINLDWFQAPATSWLARTGPQCGSTVGLWRILWSMRNKSDRWVICAYSYICILGSSLYLVGLTLVVLLLTTCYLPSDQTSNSFR